MDAIGNPGILEHLRTVARQQRHVWHNKQRWGNYTTCERRGSKSEAQISIGNGSRRRETSSPERLEKRYSRSAIFAMTGRLFIKENNKMTLAEPRAKMLHGLCMTNMLIVYMPET